MERPACGAGVDTGLLEAADEAAGDGDPDGASLAFICKWCKLWYKDNDIFPEVCPICRKQVVVNFFGDHNQSSVIHCETPDCMNITSRGL